ncbi:hypothetical protein C8A05DRAFT_38639 [Staphylotrichum tortipilum]|uniref:Uncharacterized protein n=1 Tax=Staphylotrichum tortipilum TaxID=2831512 RepID=A0AAN6RPL0_9PEZI|nr:hypothetical protein C8A05DRAFT_38639 [Staphylotrichum longicolle]
MKPTLPLLTLLTLTTATALPPTDPPTDLLPREAANNNGGGPSAELYHATPADLDKRKTGHRFGTGFSSPENNNKKNKRRTGHRFSTGFSDQNSGAVGGMGRVGMAVVVLGVAVGVVGGLI